MPSDTWVLPTLESYAIFPVCSPPVVEDVPRRTAPFDQEPGFHQETGLWLYGNVRLLHAKLAYLPEAAGPPDQDARELAELEEMTERVVLDGKILVCGIHNETHQRSAVVPLRWAAPRIVVFSGGIRHHLGPDLKEEPFRAGRLWRYHWDPLTDLAVSRRAPDKKPSYARHNSVVDNLIARIALVDWDWLGLIARPR